MIEFSCRLNRGDHRFNVAFHFAGRALALCGPSGSGKTTAARLIAGLERPDYGAIRLNGAPLVDCARQIWTPPHKRRIGLVFQDALLFPHMSVRANLNYGLKLAPKKKRLLSFKAVVDVLGIERLLERRPDTLSGGEKQRVGIGRAVLANPQLLLLDEPLASLDIARKLEILPFIERLRDEFHIPILYISHAPEEVARIADWAIYLDNGVVAAEGAPADLSPNFEASAARFDAISILRAVASDYSVDYDVTFLKHPAGEIVVPGRPSALGVAVAVAVSAANIAISIEKPENLSIRTVLPARVKRIVYEKSSFALVVAELAGGDAVRVFLTRMAADAMRLSEGQPIHLLIKTAAIDERGVANA